MLLRQCMKTSTAVSCGSVAGVIAAAYGKAIEIADANGPFEVDAVVQFECQTGFSFIEPSAVHETRCLSDGSWLAIETIAHCFCMLEIGFSNATRH